MVAAEAHPAGLAISVVSAAGQEPGPGSYAWAGFLFASAKHLTSDKHLATIKETIPSGEGSIVTTTEVQPTDVAETAPAHTLHYVNGDGDTRLTWHSGNGAEVDAARTMFNTLHGKGYRAHTVQANGEPGEIIHRFDPAAGAIVMVPQTVGG